LNLARYALFAILSLLLAAPSYAASISGTVTASHSGSALGGIVVAAYSPAGTLQASATTDSFGRYTLVNLPAGQTRVLAYDLPGTYATSYYLNAESFETSQAFSLTATQVVTGINFSMLRGGRIEGNVVAEATGVALPNMTVAAYTRSGLRREQVRTDAAGNFSLLLPPAEYILAAWDEAFVYLTEFYANVPKVSLATPISVTAGVTLGGHRFTLEVGAKVAGTVKDQGTGAALSGITISAYGPTGELLIQALSGSSGEFTMAVPPGKVRLVAHDNAGVYAGSFYRDAEAFVVATEFDLLRGASLSGIDFRLAKGGTIGGRVTDATTGAGLEGVAVAVYNLSGTTRSIVYTSVTGEYSVLLPPGYYKVAAYDFPGLYAPQFWSKRTAFPYADTAGVLTGATTSVHFALPLAARLSGIVINGTGSAIGGITVAAIDPAGIVIGRAVTDSSGTYTLVLPAGTYKLVAWDSAGRYGITFENGATSLETAPARTLVAGHLVSGVGFEMTGTGSRRRRAVSHPSAVANGSLVARVSSEECCEDSASSLIPRGGVSPDRGDH
jgi:hypothetical protein